MIDAETERLAVDLLVHAARFTRQVRREAGGHVPAALWRVLAEVEELGPIRVGDLAAADGSSQPTVTALAQRLADHGWATREVDPLDARVVLIEITDSGRAVLEEQRRLAGQALLPRLQEFDTDQLKALRAAASALADLTRPHETIHRRATL